MSEIQKLQELKIENARLKIELQNARLKIDEMIRQSNKHAKDNYDFLPYPDERDYSN